MDGIKGADVIEPLPPACIPIYTGSIHIFKNGIGKAGGRCRAPGGFNGLGVVVDAVSDVMRANTDDISNTPDFGARLNTNFMVGVATVDDKMIMLLDVNQLQPPEVADEVAKASVA